MVGTILNPLDTLYQFVLFVLCEKGTVMEMEDEKLSNLHTVTKLQGLDLNLLFLGACMKNSSCKGKICCGW